MFDENGLWQEDTYRHPGDIFSSISQMGNVLKSKDNANQNQADELYKRYLLQAKNPEAAEGFQGTPQGQDTLDTWHMQPDTGAAAVTSSPWGRERDAFKDYDPDSDPSGQGAANLMRDSGDTKGFLSAQTGVRQYKKDQDIAARGESTSYAKLVAESTKQFSSEFQKARGGGEDIDSAVGSAKIGSSTSYGMLKPEDQAKIEAMVRKQSEAQGSTGAMPTAEALVGQRNAKAGQLVAQSGLEVQKTAESKAKTAAYLKNVDSLIGMRGARQNLVNLESDNYDDKTIVAAVSAASRAKTAYDANPKGPNAEAFKAIMDRFNSSIQSKMNKSASADSGEEIPTSSAPTRAKGTTASPTKTTLAPAPAAAAAKAPAAAPVVAGKYKTINDVKAAVKAKTLPKAEAIKIMKEQFGYGD